MMLYTFIKKAGDAKRVGAECDVPFELQDALRPWSEDGWEMATAEEWDQQVVGKAQPAPAPVEPEVKMQGEIAGIEPMVQA